MRLNAPGRPPRPAADIVVSVVIRLALAIVGFFAGLLATDYFVVEYVLGGDLASYSNKWALVGGALVGSLFGTVPSWFRRR